MIRSALVFTFCILSVVARAESSCTQLLSSSSLTQNSNLKKLSSSAQAYVSLIELFIQRAGSKIDTALMSRIFDSPSFINPFVGREDTYSKQLSAGVEKLRSKITANDWKQVKKGINKLAGQVQSESQDRAEKQAKTAIIFSPKIVDQKQVGEHLSSPSWQVVEGRAFVAVSAHDNTMHLFEQVGEKLELKDTYPNSGSSFYAPVWQIVGDRTFLASVSDTSLSLFELVNGELQDKGRFSYPEISSRPKWIVNDGHISVVFSAVKKLHRYEFVNEEFKVRQVKQPKDGLASVSWITFGKRNYLATSTDRSVLSLHELVGNELLLRDSKGLGGKMTFSASWQIVGEQLLLAVGSMSNGLHIFEVSGDKLNRVVQERAVGYDYQRPAWKVINGRTFLAIGTPDSYLNIYELLKDELVLLDRHRIESTVRTLPFWFVVGKRVFLAAAFLSGKLLFYELENNSLIFKSDMSVEGAIANTPAVYVTDDNSYLAAGGENDLYLIKPFTKQGGGK